MNTCLLEKSWEQSNHPLLSTPNASLTFYIVTVTSLTERKMLRCYVCLVSINLNRQKIRLSRYLNYIDWQLLAHTTYMAIFSVRIGQIYPSLQRIFQPVYPARLTHTYHHFLNDVPSLIHAYKTLVGFLFQALKQPSVKNDSKVWNHFIDNDYVGSPQPNVRLHSSPTDVCVTSCFFMVFFLQSNALLSWP